MNWKIILLRDAILRAIDCDDTDTMKAVLEDGLLKTSDHSQERMIGEGKATLDDFFYDTYIGPHETTLLPTVGDLISFTTSAGPHGGWCAVDELGDSYEISAGTVGIVLEKNPSGFEEYVYDYRIIAGEKIFNDLSDNMFDKKQIDKK